MELTRVGSKGLTLVGSRELAIVGALWQTFMTRSSIARVTGKFLRPLIASPDGLQSRGPLRLRIDVAKRSTAE
jgi:hypothetical protein